MDQQDVLRTLTLTPPNLYHGSNPCQGQWKSTWAGRKTAPLDQEGEGEAKDNADLGNLRRSIDTKAKEEEGEEKEEGEGKEEEEEKVKM